MRNENYVFRANTNEFVLIQEAFERNVEALLGSMTETSFELADILEETDKTLEMYKSDNDDLRQKLWKSIEVIEEKNEEIDEWVDEAAMLSNENEKLKEELIMLKTKDERETKSKGNHHTRRC